MSGAAGCFRDSLDSRLHHLFLCWSSSPFPMPLTSSRRPLAAYVPDQARLGQVTQTAPHCTFESRS